MILLGFVWSYFGWPTYTRALGIHLADPEVGIMTKVYQMVSVKCQTLAEDMPRGGGGYDLSLMVVGKKRKGGSRAEAGGEE